MRVVRGLRECYTKSVRGWESTLGFVQACSQVDSVNRGDKGLGQPRQVMTAGTYGPSGQLIFDIVIPHV